MKTKIIISFVLVCSTFNLLSQQWNGDLNTTSCIDRVGQVAVGSNQNRTTIGSAWFGYGTGYLGFNLQRNNCGLGDWTFNNDGASNGGGVFWNSVGGDFLFSCKPNSGATNGTTTDADILNNINFSIRNDGKVIIGSNQWNGSNWYSWEGGNYKLFVHDGILTEKVKVAIKTTNDWSDFVFDNKYKLRPLTEVEKFIKKYKHLPDVPSADKMVEQGNDLGKTDALLLQKIEELTLYMIELKKENEAIKKQLAGLLKK